VCAAFVFVVEKYTPIMRLAQMLAGGRHGGAELFFETTCLQLHRRGMDQRVIIRPFADRVAKLQAGGCTVLTVPFRGNLDPVTPLLLPRLLRRAEPDLVLTWMSRASVACPKGAYVLCARVGGYYKPKYYRRHDYLLSISAGIKRHFVEHGWPADRIRHIPNYSLVGPEPPLQRAAFDTPPDVPLVGVLARMHPVKGIDVLLNALCAVPDAWLWIAGEGPSRAELEALAGHLGLAERVRFLGWQPRSAVLKAVDLCVVPSRYEPLGTILMDAWVHDRPLITTNAAGPAEVVRPESDALMVPTDDADALAAAIRRVLVSPDLAAQLVGAGRERMAAEFSERIVLDRYQAFFAEAAARR